MRILRAGLLFGAILTASDLTNCRFDNDALAPYFLDHTAINCTYPWQVFTIPAWSMELIARRSRKVRWHEPEVIRGGSTPTMIIARIQSQDPDGSHFLMSAGYSYGEANWCDQSTYTPQVSQDCGTLSVGQGCNLQTTIQNSGLPSYYLQFNIRWWQ